MKYTFVKDLKIGERFTDQFQVMSAEERLTTSKQSYLNLTVRDKTGQVNGKKWGAKPSDVLACVLGCIVSMTGKVEEYPLGSGTRQLNITEVHAVIDCDPQDFIPVAAKPYDELMDDMRMLVDLITDPWLNKLTKTILGSKDGQMWTEWPAAKSVHHAVKHGLLQHSVEVAQYADAIFLTRGEHSYPEQLNRSLIIAGALLHDIGKIYEYSETQNGAFDVGVGGMLGHIAIGYEAICTAILTIPGFPVEIGLKLKHIVLSHHNSGEHGSPVQPMIPEAIIVHLADLASARLYVDWDARQKYTGNGMYAKHLDGRSFVYKG